MPKVSIILSSYNHAKFVRESIENTLNQSFSDFELIIWDDGSSDDSWELIKQYSDLRIKAYRNEKNIGGVYGVNKAIFEIATGEYIAIHHSDDVWELDKLQRQVDYLAANPQTGAVFTNTQPIDERGELLVDQSHFYYNVFSQPNRSRYEWLHHFFFRGNALCHPSVLMRKQCYEDCGKYLVSLAQLTDFDMWVRLCFKYEIHVLPERLVRFRVRDSEMNASGSRPEVRIRDRSEFHYVLKHFLRISTFEELVSIFPEAEKYRRASGCVPKFVLAMIALGDASLPWAKFLAIETLFELFSDTAEREKIESLYQFNYRDLTVLTGKHDLFNQELLSSQARALTECGQVISSQAEQIRRLNLSLQAAAAEEISQKGAQDSSLVGIVSSGLSGGDVSPQDRAAYEKATRLVESGRKQEGMALLEEQVKSESSCWEVYNDIAVMCFNDGDFTRAVPYFEKGITLEGISGTTARNYAAMLLMSGDVSGAMGVWGRILREQPHDADILTTIREVLSNLKPIAPEIWQRLLLDLRGGEYGENIRLRENKLSPTNTRVAKDIKIFQIFYDDVTRSKIDPDFIALDNTENLRPDWCEYWSIRKVLLNTVFDEDAYIGFLSPKFFEKTGMRGNEVLKKVQDIDDDVISFSPYFDLGAIHQNPFVQGEAHHPGLSRAMQKVLSLLQIDLDLNSLVCDQTTTIYSNYFVARYSFWKKWFEYAETIFAVCEGPDCELKSILVGGTTYREGTDYAMKVFVLERLVTVVMEELGIASRIGIDIGEAPLILPGSKGNLVAFLVCDALKGQYLNTGNPAYKDAFFKLRGSVIVS